MISSTRKQPTQRIFAVEKRNGKSFWRPIGAAWAHSKGDGFSITLDYLPLNGAEIVMRAPMAEDDQMPQEGQEGGAQ